MIEIAESFNLTTAFLDYNLQRGYGDRIALRTESETLSYADVARAVGRTGHALREAGVEMEQRVLLFLPDIPEFVYGWFGAVRAGAVVAAVNPEVKAEEAAYYLNYTRAKVALACAQSLPALRSVRSQCPFLRELWVVGVPPGPGERSFEAVCAKQPEDLVPAPTHRDDPAVWLFTSGSTGFPKAAVHRQADFLFATEAYGLPFLELKPDDICLSVPKLFFGYALGNNLLFPFRAGASSVLFPDKSSPERLFALMERFSTTVLCNVPTMVNTMVNASAFKEGALEGPWRSLRLATSAGEALPSELYQRWRERFGVELLDGIGSAEMFHVFVSQRIGAVRPGSLGRAVEGYDVRLMDDEGHEVADGEIGTLWVRGPSMAQSYFQRRETSQATFRGEWCVTADKFVRDAEGYFWYRGRSDDLLKVNGRFVAPSEIENCLLGHPAILEVAVVGYRDAQDLEKPRAFVVLRPGRLPCEELVEELKLYVKQRLQPFKYPRQIQFLEALPKSDRGKVLRQSLSQL